MAPETDTAMFDGIDIELLEQQRLELVRVIWDQPDSILWGLVNMLDAWADDRFPGTVYICRECMSAECGAENGRLLVRISRKQYETRENVCPRCDRIETFCNCEVY